VDDPGDAPPVPEPVMIDEAVFMLIVVLVGIVILELMEQTR
jgi:hypothetical protein